MCTNWGHLTTLHTYILFSVIKSLNSFDWINSGKRGSSSDSGQGTKATQRFSLQSSFAADGRGERHGWSKSGNLSIREILVLTSAYARTLYTRTLVRPYASTDSGGGTWESQGNPMVGWKRHLFLAGNRALLLGNQRFSWREIAWSPSILASLAKRFSSTEEKFRTCEKISSIYKWKEEVQKNTQLSFWWKAKPSSYEICLQGLHLCCDLLRTRSAWVCGIWQRSGWRQL